MHELPRYELDRTIQISYLVSLLRLSMYLNIYIYAQITRLM